MTMAHETMHVFGAVDEYAASDCTCAPAGFYQVPNRNCINCANSQVPCLMNTHTDFICE